MWAQIAGGEVQTAWQQKLWALQKVSVVVHERQPRAQLNGSHAHVHSHGPYTHVPLVP